jgi:hypothetical protein
VGFSPVYSIHLCNLRNLRIAFSLKLLVRIDTSRINLSADIVELTERLAENIHAVWAEQRMNDGWTYGPKRDDASKQHPGLVPYADLPETEKEYDRHTAMQTLKLILALGYRIEKAKGDRFDIGHWVSWSDKF